MTIQDILQTVRTAKRAHISWVMKADALIHGIPLEESQIPMDGTECSFGKWYYGQGQCCIELPSFKALEKPHMELHSTYAKIFSAIYEKSEHSLLSSMFGKKKKVDQQKLELVRSLFTELKVYSDDLIDKLEILENDILNLPNA